MAKVKSDLSRLKLVRIGRPLSKRTLDRFAQRILDAFANIIHEFELVQYDPPVFEEIEAGLLTKALDEEVGGHILGFTEADLLDHRGADFFSFMFGGKDNRNDVAVVSTRRLAAGDGSLREDRVLKVGLHELGHNFGLVHHYSLDTGADGAYCPMTKGDYNRFGERGYLRAIVDGRGFRFCNLCRAFLESRFA